MIPHTGTILTASAADKHDTVLLNVVALAGNVGRDMAARAETHTSSLTLSGIGLLGPLNTDFEADTLLLRALRIGEGRRDGVASALASSDFLLKQFC